MLGWSPWFYWVFGGAALAAGLIGVAWALFWDRARGRRRCPRCWYDMSGAIPRDPRGYVCPECGRESHRERHLQRTRRRWGTAALAAAAIIAGTWATLWPSVRTDGWLALVPTRVLLWAAFSQSYGSNLAIHAELSYHRFARFSLARSHPSAMVGVLLDRLRNDPDPNHRDFAASLLAWVGGRDPRITPALLVALKAPEAPVRVRIIRSLGIYLADCNQVLPRLIAIILDPSEDPAVRSEACGVVALYGHRASSAAPALLAAMAAPDADVQIAAAGSIGDVGADPKSAVPRLVGSLAPPPSSFGWNAESTVWIGVVSSLGKFKSESAAIVPVLQKALQSPLDPTFRNAAILALGRLGPAAASSIPQIQNIANDPNETEESIVTASAALAVIAGRRPDIASALADVIADPNSLQRLAAVRLLRRERGPAAPALPTLIAELEAGMDPIVLSEICSLLPYIQESTDQTLKTLRELRKRWTNGIVDYAIDGIERQETGTKP